VGFDLSSGIHVKYWLIRKLVINKDGYYKREGLFHNHIPVE